MSVVEKIPGNLNQEPIPQDVLFDQIMQARVARQRIVSVFTSTRSSLSPEQTDQFEMFLDQTQHIAGYTKLPEKMPRYGVETASQIVLAGVSAHEELNRRITHLLEQGVEGSNRFFTEAISSAARAALIESRPESENSDMMLLAQRKFLELRVPIDERIAQENMQRKIQEGLVQYEALVKNFARKTGSYGVLEYDDLVSVGMMGLVEAITKFTPQGASFLSYASRIVRGRMIDAIRLSGGKSRTTIRNKIQYDRFLYGFMVENGRSPSRDEIMSGMNITETQIDSILGQGEKVRLSEEQWRLVEGGQTVAIQDQSEYSNPEDRMVRAEEEQEKHQKLQGIAQAMGRLPERARKIFQLYYFDNYRFSDIASALGVSESRVVQLHQAAIERIRSGILVGNPEEAEKPLEIDDSKLSPAEMVLKRYAQGELKMGIARDLNQEDMDRIHAILVNIAGVKVASYYGLAKLVNSGEGRKDLNKIVRAVSKISEGEQRVILEVLGLVDGVPKKPRTIQKQMKASPGSVEFLLELARRGIKEGKSMVVEMK